jgi:Tfp pilus assembly protein PilF
VGDKLLAVLSLLKDDKGRQQHISQWMDKIPNAPKPMLLQAITYQERGQNIKASEMYQKVLMLQPNNVAALNNLGWLYFEVNDERSEDLLEQAVELAPSNPAVLDSLGWVLYKRGKVDAGIGYLEKAAGLAPDSEEIAEHLAEARKGR